MGFRDCSGFSVNGRVGKQAGRGEKEAGSELRFRNGTGLGFSALVQLALCSRPFSVVGHLEYCGVFRNILGLYALHAMNTIRIL